MVQTDLGYGGLPPILGVDAAPMLYLSPFREADMQPMRCMTWYHSNSLLLHSRPYTDGDRPRLRRSGTAQWQQYGLPGYGAHMLK